MVYESRPKLSVTMHIPMAVFDPFFRSLAVDPRFKANYCIAKHIETGATLECVDQTYEIRNIIMRGRDIPIR